ncbi:cache domain-containing protein [Pseudodesulfovibrio sp.]|nr:cache domain-containing protein [Pseudodesulfovibrio sp.]
MALYRALFVVLALVLFATIAIAGTDISKAQILVDKGISHVETVGADQAARDFMQQDGGFIDDSYYLLFYTYDGTCLALGAKPEIAGKNRWNVHDPDGVYQVREMIKLAKAGGGWVKYKYANPTTGDIQNKKTWVQPVPGMDAFIGCGIYY